MAYYAARFAYFAKEYDKAEKYADIAIKDTAMADDALQLKLAVMQNQLKSHEDTLNYVNKLKSIYANDEIMIWYSVQYAQCSYLLMTRLVFQNLLK